MEEKKNDLYYIVLIFNLYWNSLKINQINYQ